MILNVMNRTELIRIIERSCALKKNLVETKNIQAYHDSLPNQEIFQIDLLSS